MSSRFLASRSGQFRNSVIAETAREARLRGAVDLAMGSPDFPALELLKEAAVAAIRGNRNQYVTNAGLPEVRAAVAAKVHRHLGVEVDPVEEVTITCGSTEGFFLALLATLEPGDEVILFEPYYESYVSVVRLLGGVPRFVPLHPPSWGFDAGELAAACTPRTRAVVLNTPSNPTGRVFTAEDLALVAELCREHDLLCLSDEIYEHIVFDGRRHQSILALPGMRERTVMLSAISKSHTLTGWRVGWLVAPPAITDIVRKGHEVVTVTAPAPLQVAALTALELPDDYYHGLSAFYQARRDQLLAILAPLGFTGSPAQGAFYQMADFATLTDLDDLELARFLIVELGVAAVPGRVFYLDPAGGARKLRFCFGKSPKTLAAAAERLAALPERLAARRGAPVG